MGPPYPGRAWPFHQLQNSFLYFSSEFYYLEVRKQVSKYIFVTFLDSPWPLAKLDHHPRGMELETRSPCTMFATLGNVHEALLGHMLFLHSND